jgi:beta-galactosidase
MKYYSAMKFGVCYYPEQWPEERWPIDAGLMRKVGLSYVRLTDFAWAVLEPSEGKFDWKWLDRLIEVLSAEDLQVILCTPTASPPPWLCRAYPDILPVDAQGRQRRPGSRRHYCPNSSTYQQHTTRIVKAMASHYGSNPVIVGWQIDNEFGCHSTARCYCDNCATSFRRWLQGKYETIDSLNQAWGTIFWSQVYADWSEIDPPNLTIAEPNPSHVLDYYRFSSDSFISYQQLQISTLKPLISEHQIVTTNFMSQFSDLDYYGLASPLDLVTMSSYPTGHAESKSSLYMPSSTQPDLAYDVGDPYLTSLGHTLMRGFKSNRPFWVMEQQCGNVNWSTYNTGVRPGTVRLWTWHALASGAEAVLYFRWRAGLFAQEQFHSGLLNHDATPSVGFADLESMEAERSLMAEINQAPYSAQIAFLFDYDSLWALGLQSHHRDISYIRHLFIYYRALQSLGLPADIISADADLDPYKLLILPTAFLATEQLAHSLQAFVERGGSVLLGVRSGFKTTSNQVVEHPLPGLLRNLIGFTVNNWHSLPPGVSYNLSSTIPGLDGSATVWAEALSPNKAPSQSSHPKLKVHAHYISGPFSSSPALVEHKLGSGRTLYLGWIPTDAQAKALLAYLVSGSGINTLAELPEGVISFQRGQKLIFLNFTDQPQLVLVQGQSILVRARNLEIVQMNGLKD